MSESPIVGFPAEPQELTESQKSAAVIVRRAIDDVQSAIEQLAKLMQTFHVTMIKSSLERDVRTMRRWLGEYVPNDDWPKFVGGPYDGDNNKMCCGTRAIFQLAPRKWAMYFRRDDVYEFMGYETSEAKSKRVVDEKQKAAQR